MVYNENMKNSSGNNMNSKVDNGEWSSLGAEVPFRSESMRSIERIKELATDMKTAPEGTLSEDFKSGVYLFHSARVNEIEEIFESGEILNASEIYKRKIETKRKEMQEGGMSQQEIEGELRKIGVVRNSGQEGISWSVNGIEAMPGTRGEIAGFVAAPELVLRDDKLVIPSRPAPYELLQVSNNIDTKRFFEAKKQHEVWGYKELSLSESANVESGLMKLYMNIKNGDKPDRYQLYRSRLKEFDEMGGLSADELRKHFKILEDGHVKLDEDLHQQQFDEKYLPPAAVYMQALIDSGVFRGTLGENKSVAELVGMCGKYENLLPYILGQARKESKRYADIYEEEFEKVEKVGARVEDMYFVTNRKDLDKWIAIMEKTGHVPRGILLYDDAKIVRENFASDEPGDHAEMADEIGRVVMVDEGFWKNKLGMNVENIARAGTHGQVLKDSEVNHNIEVKMVDGKLEVIRL